MKKAYKDVTKKWVRNVRPNSHEVLELRTVLCNGTRYEVDNKNVILDYSIKELEMARWLECTFGGELYMLPRVNNPCGIQTSDYLFRGDYWDLKTIVGFSNQTFYHAIYKKKKQCNNFIFDISGSKISIKKAIKLVDTLYKRLDTQFVNMIIIIKDNKFRIYKKRVRPRC